MSLGEIEKLTRVFTDARDVLAERVQTLHDELEAAKRRKLLGIRNAVAAVAEARDRLHAAIEAAPHLFEKPKTIVIGGVRVGFAKGKGKIEWEDDEQVVKLIRKHFGDRFDELVKTTEKPRKGPLNELSVAELRRLGITVEETGDQVVIKPTDTAVDKLVKTLLKEAEDKVEAA